jgi:Tfp pilus assembly protein PilE
LHLLFLDRAIKPARAPVDKEPMVRAFGFISLLATLAVVGYLYAQSAGEATQPSGATAVEGMALDAAADATLLAAKTGVESYFATSGTYVGAAVPAGVTLVTADAASYCLQAGTGAATHHLTVPGGSPAPGPC